MVFVAKEKVSRTLSTGGGMASSDIGKRRGSLYDSNRTYSLPSVKEGPDATALVVTVSSELVRSPWI